MCYHSCLGHSCIFKSRVHHFINLFVRWYIGKVLVLPVHTYLLLSLNLRVVADTETDSKQHVKYTDDDGDFHLVSIQEANFVFSNLKMIKVIWMTKIFSCFFWFYYLMFSLHSSTFFVPIGWTTPCTTEVNPEEI